MRDRRRPEPPESAEAEREAAPPGTVPARSRSSDLPGQRFTGQAKWPHLFLRALLVRCLTAAVLRALEAQLGVLVEAHPPHLDHVFGCRGDEREAVTTGSRRDLPQIHNNSCSRALVQHESSWFSLKYIVLLIHLLGRLQPVRSQLVFAGLLPAAVRHHEAGDTQSAGEAEAPHKHFVVRLPVLTDILKNRSGATAAFRRSGGFTESRVAADSKPRKSRVSSAQSHT